ncbi:hypothetical protein ACWEQA_35675 [Nocardia sp. NPDC004085]
MGADWLTNPACRCPRHGVVERREFIRFELDATSCGDADERYLMGGDETGSKSPTMPTMLEIGLD